MEKSILLYYVQRSENRSVPREADYKKDDSGQGGSVQLSNAISNRSVAGLMSGYSVAGCN